MSKPETLPEIAERLTIGATLRTLYEQEALILAALGEVEKRGEQRAAKLGGALLDSAVERVKEAEARVDKLADKLSDWALSDDMTNILGAGGSYVELEKTCNELALRAEKAEAEVERLREALTAAQVAANKSEAEVARLVNLKRADFELLSVNERLREELTAAQVRSNELAAEVKRLGDELWLLRTAVTPAKEPKP